MAERLIRRSACFCLLATCVTLAAGAGEPGAGPGRVYDVKPLEANSWRVPFYNDGRYGLDLSGGTDEAGGLWPFPHHNHYLYGAGVWFGRRVPNKDDSARTDTLVSFSYDPHSHASEMTPVATRYAEAGPVDPADRVFSYPGDWPPAPRSRFVTNPALESLVPVQNVSLGDLWCVYSDAEPLNHSGRGRPAGIDVYQSVYAWNYQLSEDIFFVTYQVRNAGYEALRHCYIAAISDPDIGNPQDDMAGFYRSLELPGIAPVTDLGFCGDIDNAEQPGPAWENGVPGAVGYKLLAGPGGARLSAFKRFSRDTDPSKDATQYMMLAGYDYRSGQRQPFDTLDQSPADKRFALSCGPFDLAPGEVERLVFAVFAAPYGGADQVWRSRPLDSLEHLCRIAAFAQFVFDQGWLLPGPPALPGVTLVPGDNSVRVVWDNLPEVTPDPYYDKVASKPWPAPGHDPKYRAKDFEGYVVYKSPDGSDWSILAQCDLADSIVFRYPPDGDSIAADSLWIKATDSGVFYSILDDDVTNGYTYYYCVTAYDWNYVTTDWDTTRVPPVPLAWDTLVLRTGLATNQSTVPRWDAANYLNPLTEIVVVAGDTTRNGLRLTSTVVVPYQVLGDTFEAKFLAPGYVAQAKGRYRYYVAKKSDGSLVVDTASFEYVVGDTVAFSMPVFNGQETRLRLNYKIPAKPYDAAYVLTGSYPADRLRPAVSSFPGAQKAAWCFRGSDYRVEWTTMAGGQLTAKVYDVTNGGVEVPYTKFESARPQDANGWCFANRVAAKPTDTLTTGAALLYVCGGYIAMNYTTREDSLGTMLDSIHDGDVWMLAGHKDEGTAAYYNSYWLTSQPGVEQTDSSYTLSVKVVPNPYIVFNDWDLNSDNRRVKFTHLPMTCTIRIFTLSGDLVKTLEHRDDGRHPLDEGGTEGWDLLSDFSLPVVSGIYVYHVESEAGECFGKLAVVH